MRDAVAAKGDQIARAILAGFDKHYRLFRDMSRGAKERFEQGAWREIKEAHRARIDMYATRVREAVDVLREHFPDSLGDTHWPAIKRAYIELLLSHQQPELAETFFNSVACRVLARTYFNNQ